MIMVIFWSLVLSIAINMAMFVVAYIRQSDKLTDISYAVTFIVVALMAFIGSQQTLIDIILLGMVLVWALRLGGFLLWRVLRVGKDHRFDDMRGNFVQFGKFWLAQATTVWLLTWPVVMAYSGEPEWSIISIIGLSLWLVGFYIETLADKQKFAFKQYKTNKNKWIDTGIWRYSRHPNYFGEILVWTGIYLYSVPYLTSIQALVALVSPVFIILLLRFVSGIPILEKSADAKWGNDPAYQRYKQRTPLLVPFITPR